MDQVDININPHLSSDYINYLEKPLEIIKEAETAAERDIWSLMQFTENLRRQHGKEPHSMEILLKKLYVRRMAADLGITKIRSSGKMVVMETNMSKKAFKLIADSMVSDVHRNSLIFEGNRIKVINSYRIWFSFCAIYRFVVQSVWILFTSPFPCCRRNFF